MKKQIPYLNDVLQEKKILTTPQIRVWCHPHKIGQDDDDYYTKFDTFRQAECFIKNHPEAEGIPLIAFAGKEINIYELLEDKK